MARPVVITSGYGKSKYPAMYLADALSTMSIPALFLDPLDADHGGLGKVDVMSELGDIEFYMFSRSASNEAIAFTQRMYEQYDLRARIICEDTLRAVIHEHENDNIVFVKYALVDTDDNCPPTDSIASAMSIAARIVTSFKEEFDPDGVIARCNHPAKTYLS